MPVPTFSYRGRQDTTRKTARWHWQMSRRKILLSVQAHIGSSASAASEWSDFTWKPLAMGRLFAHQHWQSKGVNVFSQHNNYLAPFDCQCHPAGFTFLVAS